MMTTERLQEIKRRSLAGPAPENFIQMLNKDIPDLITEVERLRKRLTKIEYDHQDCGVEWEEDHVDDRKSRKS